LCYARIAPAALQRSDLQNCRNENGEAVGHEPDFQVKGFPWLSRTRGFAGYDRFGWRQVEQNMPAA
jgi:hypothetical protein